MNDKQRRFAHEYIIDCNASAAAVRAGYSPRGANAKGSELYNTPEIFSYIKGLQYKLEETTGVTAAMVVAELAKVGFHNIKDFVNGSNSVLELKGLDSDKTAAVAGVKTTVNTKSFDVTTEIKFHDKVSALEKLGRHLGIFEKDNGQRKIELSGVIVTTKEAKEISDALEGEV